jgi:CBS domain containing-hemolysin-like protein
MVLLFVYLALALGVSFICSVLEAVLLSISTPFIAQLENTRPHLGQKMRQLKDHIDRPLSAILSLNTIAHTVGATGVGAQAVAVFGHAYVGVISAVLTLLILLISEIIPKTLGAIYWRQLAPAFVYMMVPVTWSMWPLVKAFEGLTRLLKSGDGAMKVEREEFLALIKQGSEGGAFNENESRILNNLFLAHELNVRDIMTPRTVIFALDVNLSVDEVWEAQPQISFSRIPVYDKSRDDIVGFVLKSDLLVCALNQRGHTTLAELRRPIAVVLGRTPMARIFYRLIGNQDHIALVMEENGEIEGLVTMEDLIETLIGLEIIDESDPVRDMRQLAREQWARRARHMGLDVDSQE